MNAKTIFEFLNDSSTDEDVMLLDSLSSDNDIADAIKEEIILNQIEINNLEAGESSGGRRGGSVVGRSVLDLNGFSVSTQLETLASLLERNAIRESLERISFHTTNEALTESFSQFGQVIEAKIITDRVSERSKGFGFVTFASEDEAEKAIAEMNGKVLNGRTVFVDTAKPTTHAENRMPIACGPPELNKQESFKRIPLGIDYL
ncbi:hypothetical protein GIB67_013650 [Kingdonia uniflora]|uniref:RRM domain-containing protein n=1 Tax=Kingdonia uniflora TaxID=39325 RepID=A0A7J7NQ98_9MAGN|nr:hypothetical protein GIB67_013650 [Kingdonia uniflora]